MIEEVIHGECIEVMRRLPDRCVDMILCDLPYGTTHCSWDSVIPFADLWGQYRRLIKDLGAIVLTCSQPFTSMLLVSNPKMFRHEWIWEKHQGTNPMNAKVAPLKSHENILVFASGKTRYYPQMELGAPYSGFVSDAPQSEVYREDLRSVHRDNKEGTRYPKTVLRFTKDRGKRFHPTQKPVALFEYLINTYTLPGDVILDNCAGSGTTGVAARNLGRNFILIEQEAKYIQCINARLAREV